MTTDPAPQADVRTRILDCALGLMSDRGSAGTSMRRLAGASGVNVATIYHYFPSKADLLTAVIAERHYGERMATDEPALDPALPARERLVALLQWLWVGTMAEKAMLRLLIGEGLRGVAEAQHAAAGLLDSLEQTLTGRLSDAFPEFEQHRIDPAVVARLARRHLVAIVIEQLATGHADPEAAARDLAATVF